jgi:hypothetical protein
MMPGMGGTPPPPPGYQPPQLPSTAAGSSAGLFRGRLVIVQGTGPNSGLFVYAGIPALGNPPIFWATSAAIDPFGNVLSSTAGVAGSGTFQAGNTIIDPTGNYVYSGTPGAGNLIASLTPAAGNDQFANAHPQGLLSNQLTLPNQGSAPPAFTGASVLYSSSLGRLRYLSSAGADLVLDRSALNINTFSMNTQTTPVVMSGALNYLANEAVVGSEYEVEIDGTITTPNTTSATFTFDFYLDGNPMSTGGNAETIGIVIIQTGFTYAFHVTYRFTVVTTGAFGSGNVMMDGSLTRKGVNVGNAQQFTTLNQVSVNNTIDTTVNHTFAIYCAWGSTTGTGHSAITYRTKITRRN